jgi:SagB-type dehydrogenase family enzyme
MHTSLWTLEEARDDLVGARNLFSVSELFHENSRITAAAPKMAQSPGAATVAPQSFKRYLHSPRTALPEVLHDPIGDVLDAVVRRRSCREHSGAALLPGHLSQLCFLAAGCRADDRRCIPSAGGLYPLELYVAVSRVAGIAPGVYHYDPRAHGLARLSDGDSLDAIAASIFVPEATQGAGAVFLITAMFGRSKIKYGERAYRFALLEAGHAMQNLLLGATALELGACPIGGFIDDRLNDILQIDGVEEAALYAAIVGVPIP